MKDGRRAALLARGDGIGDGRAREELANKLVARLAREMRLQHGENLAIEAAVKDAARGVAVRQHVETARLKLGRLRAGVAAVALVAAGERIVTSVVWFALSMVAFPRKRTWLNCVRDARTPDQGGQTRNEHPYVYGFRQLGFVNRVCCARFVAG